MEWCSEPKSIGKIMQVGKNCSKVSWIINKVPGSFMNRIKSYKNLTNIITYNLCIYIIKIHAIWYCIKIFLSSYKFCFSYSFPLQPRTSNSHLFFVEAAGGSTNFSIRWSASFCRLGEDDIRNALVVFWQFWFWKPPRLKRLCFFSAPKMIPCFKTWQKKDSQKFRFKDS